MFIEKPKLDLEDEVVLPVNYVDHNFVRRKRFCLGLLHYSTPRADPDHISYRQYLTTRESCSAERIVIAGNETDSSNTDNSDEPECSNKRTTKECENKLDETFKSDNSDVE